MNYGEVCYGRNHHPTYYKSDRSTVQIIEHAGYERAILSRNPPLVDEDGYEIGSDDDEEAVQNAHAEAAQQNPYAGTQLHGASLRALQLSHSCSSTDT